MNPSVEIHTDAVKHLRVTGSEVLEINAMGIFIEDEDDADFFEVIPWSQITKMKFRKDDFETRSLFGLYDLPYREREEAQS